jgi:hypothetical protein
MHFRCVARVAHRRLLGGSRSQPCPPFALSLLSSGRCAVLDFVERLKRSPPSLPFSRSALVACGLRGWPCARRRGVPCSSRSKSRVKPLPFFR